MNAGGRVLRRVLQEDSGQNLIEYALVAFLIGLAAVTAMSSLSNKIVAAYSSVNSRLAGAM